MVEYPFVLGRCIDGRENCRRCKKDCDRFFHKILCVYSFVLSYHIIRKYKLFFLNVHAYTGKSLFNDAK
jgi:hypothetical protein